MTSNPTQSSPKEATTPPDTSSCRELLLIVDVMPVQQMQEIANGAKAVSSPVLPAAIQQPEDDEPPTNGGQARVDINREESVAPKANAQATNSIGAPEEENGARDSQAHEKEKTGSTEPKLNEGQQAIFDLIMKVVRAQKEQIDNLETAQLSDDQRKIRLKEIGDSAVRLIVSGTAGTGKSFLIKKLTDQISMEFPSDSTQPTVIVAAYTGLAAVQIGGRTCHSIFRINVNKWTYLKEGDKDLATLRNTFARCLLVVLDEFSMLGNEMLAKIDFRLKEAKNCASLFGGITTVLAGDPLQLPPVLAKQIFEDVKHYGFAEDNLFREFMYRELEVNMRQGENNYAAVMLRMRTQTNTHGDCEQLRTRLITPSPGESQVSMERAVEHFRQLQRSDDRAMALYGTNNEVNDFNSRVANEMEVVEIPAVKRSGNGTEEAAEKDPEADRLDKMLKLALHGRVMLRRNIDVKKGLVNGATGTLEEIIGDNEEVSVLRVRFDGHDELTELRRVYAFTPGREHQFPIVMAFAATVHKAQGLTLKTLMLSMKGFHGDGQAFVAFSRVKTIEGLHLIDFDASKIRCNLQSLLVLNGLRATIGLPPLPVPQSTHYTSTDPAFMYVRNNEDLEINGIANILHSLPSFVERLRCSTSNQVVDILISASKRRFEDRDAPGRLRRLLEQTNGKMSMTQLLRTIIMSLDLKNDFLISIDYVATCSGGCKEACNRKSRWLGLSYVDETPRKIEDLAQATILASSRAKKCTACSNEIQGVEILRCKMPRYLLLLNNIVIDGSLSHISFSGITARETIIFNVPYKMTGGLQYKKEGKRYETESWRKVHGDGWSIEDKNGIRNHDKLPNHSKGFRLMAFYDPQYMTQNLPS